MKVVINGVENKIDDNISIRSLLKSLNYTNIKSTAVAINLEFIQRNQYDAVTLKENDDVEIVIPMQGG